MTYIQRMTHIVVKNAGEIILLKQQWITYNKMKNANVLKIQYIIIQTAQQYIT